MWRIKIPKLIAIHPDGKAPGVRLAEVARFLRQFAAGSTIKIGKPFFPSLLKNKKSATEFARALVAARVSNPYREAGGEHVFPAEIEYELRRITNPSHTMFGVMYDAPRLAEIYRSLLNENQSDRMDLFVTNQLIGSMSYADKRYHARTVWLSFPSIISVPGITIAPARSREHHIAKQMGIEEDITHDDFIAHGDPRTTEVVKGLALQALFFHINGEAFCDNPDCRLFNAHRQSELIRAHLGKNCALCNAHTKTLSGNI